jgi:hypothetical protein
MGGRNGKPISKGSTDIVFLNSKEAAISDSHCQTVRCCSSSWWGSAVSPDLLKERVSPGGNQGRR